MILDNENKNLKVHEWITKYSKEGKMSIVTGYFTVSALAYLSETTKNVIGNYRFILGDIVNADIERQHALDLLNEEINIETALQLTSLAKEAVAFLELKTVEAKTLEPNFCHAKTYIHTSEIDGKDHYFISGSSNLTDSGIGKKSNCNIELNIAETGNNAQYKELVDWFESLWVNKKSHDNKTIIDAQKREHKVPFKEYLITEIKKLFHTYEPLELYYKVLYELFNQELDFELNDKDFIQKLGRLQNTKIYNSLYEFQQKGVISLIKMLKKHNGAILADAVGLGKTWSALAVIKYFNFEGYRTVLLCPKKLEQNWSKFLEDGNKFYDDNFQFKIRFHTDLTDGRWDSYSKEQSYKINQMLDDNPKLIVIDESHNLRNGKSNRFLYLLHEILEKVKGDIKILMLSATPINNSMNDIRNQFRLITKGNDKGFEDKIDVKSLHHTFNKAQFEMNQWSKIPHQSLGALIKAMPDNFFKLTDALIVARTRKMIAGHQNGLIFPKKEKPKNLFVTPRHIGNFENFEELFNHFPPMLSGYQPSYYIPQQKNIDKTKDEKQREHFLVKMLYILMVKRLESSWFSFDSTVSKILAHHQIALNRIINFEQTKKDNDIDIDQLSLFNDDDDLQTKLESFTLGKKRPVSLMDIHRAGNLDLYKTHLKKDIDCLQILVSNLETFNKNLNNETQITFNKKSKDEKLQKLIEIIIEKRNADTNNRNQKVLIFTVYKDTAQYLFNQLKARGFDKMAFISGNGSKIWNEEHETRLFEPILERFAPYTKLFLEKEWSFKPSDNQLSTNQQYFEWQNWVSNHDEATYRKLQNPIDILIATDTLSEGQNLQDCDMVINYDIHWNPVRVIQRFGRIDRLGSPNETITGVNFWPTDNINHYLKLQNRIEQRMATMKLAGAEVHSEFTETFALISEDEELERKQTDKMLLQMQSTLEEIDSEQSFGFDDLSMETYRQDLLLELEKDKEKYTAMPKGVFTGFVRHEDKANEQGLIALMGYPCKKPNTEKHIYKGYELIYINYAGKSVQINQKEVLDTLAFHKDEPRDNDGLKKIDEGQPNEVKKLAEAIMKWLNAQAKQTEIDEQGNTKEIIGKADLDLLNKLKTGSKQAIIDLANEGNPSSKFNKDNFDLITWFIVN